MKLICLNAWGGKRKEELGQFLQAHHDADIICLQEVCSEAEGKDKFFWMQNIDLNHLDTLKKQLPGYEAFYHPHLGDWWGLAMFIKKGVVVENVGEVYVHEEKGFNYDLEIIGHTAKNLQYGRIQTPLGTRVVINFHGLYTGKGKEDTESRLLQSKNIVAFLKTLKDPYILCGDFNLNPNTDSIGILEAHGLRNLIKEFGITSTRTSLYTKEGKYADYVLVSGGIEALDFAVLPDEVSDHSPLYLEFQ
jgi:endonuclease/exonuclease/phosphatase family metal-dependent hydrolase